MNGAKYAAFNIDSLDFDFTGGGGSSSSAAQDNQPLYHGPQETGYDPSAAPPPANPTLGTYNASVSNGIHHSHQPQQPPHHQQNTMLAAVGVNDYIQPRDQALLTTFLGTSTPPPPASHYAQQQPQHLLNAARATQYQPQQRAARSNGTLSPFDPLPISLPQRQAAQVQATHQVHSPNPHHAFEDFLLSALVNQVTNPSSSSSSTVDAIASAASSGNGILSAAVTKHNKPQPKKEEFNQPWLQEIKISVSSLSLEPLSGAEVMKRLQTRMDDVTTKFLPCVDFLVQCQQDLRKGLVHAQRKVGSGRRYFQPQMTPRQFWAAYVEPLPSRFITKNQHVMDSKTLNEAVTGLEKLRKDAKGSVDASCEAVKNSFLGGMKEGESWGLRKWLSRHGSALAACTDLECILKACKTLDKSLDSTKQLAALIRPLATRTLTRLKNDVPASYQERSSAHPYLPFFHRLEGALRDASQFDPNDDGVICLDDSDDDDDVVEVTKPPPKKSAPPARAKRKAKEIPQKQEEATNATDAFVRALEIETTPPPTPKPKNNDDDGSSSGSDEECEIIEIVAGQPGPSTSPSPEDVVNDASELLGISSELDQLFNSTDDFLEEEPPPRPPPKKRKRKSSAKSKEVDLTSHLWPIAVDLTTFQAVSDDAGRTASRLESLAIFFQENREAEIRPMTAPRGPFWNGERYADALVLFASILRHPEAAHFMENVSEDRLVNANPEKGRYTHIIKSPLCFRDIAGALLLDPTNEEDAGLSDGLLPIRSLSAWNMWKGIDLLQALDLVFLNSLAYGKITGEGRSRHRARTNELRKMLWTRIQDIVGSHVPSDDTERKRQYTPTRRSESSGFVVFKYKE